MVTVGRHRSPPEGSPGPPQVPGARGRGVRGLPAVTPPVVRAPGAPAGPIERASAGDLMQLACDVGAAPMQVGAVLVLGGGDARVAPPDLGAVRAAIAARTRGIPRLRQRLVRVPPGCGRPIWVDDGDFTIERHVTATACPGAGDERALLAVAADQLARRLPGDRPPWSATLVTGLDPGFAGATSALIVLFDHVLADGIGGLAMLAGLVDGSSPPGPSPGAPAADPGPAASPAPRPVPACADLVLDAAASRLRALAHVAGGARQLLAALVELGGTRPPRAAASALNRPVTAARRLAVARVGLDPVRDLAHRHHATVNDVVLTAATGMLTSVLDAWPDAGPERIDELVVSVPVAGRTGTTGTRLGNKVGVMPVAVPTPGTPTERLARVAATTSRRRTRQPGASTALVGPAFRALGALGLLRPLIDRQRLVNTFVTNLRGPAGPLAFLGSTVRQVIPLSTLAGNVTVAFAVLSYAGTLAVTVVTDPARAPAADALALGLEHELLAMTRGWSRPAPTTH